MPAALDKCVIALRKQGKSEARAFAICTASLQRAGILKKGSQKLTKKGKSK